MKILLHGGHFKTGTTSFQSLLAREAAGLRALGIYVPSAPRGNHGFPLRKAMLGSNDQLLRQLEHAERSGARWCILSAEVVAHFDEQEFARLAELLNRWPVRLYFVLRHWNSFLPARYAQNIRRCDYLSWSQFLDEMQIHGDAHPDANFALLISRGRILSDDIQLCAYETDAAARKILIEAGVASETVGSMLNQPLSLNRSYSWDFVEILRLVNSVIGESRGLDPDQKLRQVFHRDLAIKLLDRESWLACLNQTDPVLWSELHQCVAERQQTGDCQSLSNKMMQWSQGLERVLRAVNGAHPFAGFETIEDVGRVSWSSACPSDLSRESRRKILDSFDADLPNGWAR